MFGLGFTEILLIAIVALLFIGPDKLPETMKTIAKTLGKAKRMFDDTKSTIENELRVHDLREEALQYKQQIEDSKKLLASFKNIANKEINEIKNEATLTKLDMADDASIDELFDEADNDFKELESNTQKVEIPKKQEEAKEELATTSETTSGFKHLKPKDS